MASMLGEDFQPHRYLRQWRLRAGLTLQEVAALEGTVHSAVQRMEMGKVKVSSERLAALARIYGAKHPLELLFPPDQQGLVEQLLQHLELLQRMDEEGAAMWLAMGEKIAIAVEATNRDSRPAEMPPEADLQGNTAQK